MKPISSIWKRPMGFRLGIRQQLTIIVCVFLIIATVVVCSVTATTNRNYILDLQRQQLSEVALLKSLQIQQLIRSRSTELLISNLLVNLGFVMRQYNTSTGSLDDGQTARVSNSFSNYFSQAPYLIEAVLYDTDFKGLVAYSRAECDFQSIQPQLFPLDSRENGIDNGPDDTGIYPSNDYLETNVTLMGPFQAGCSNITSGYDNSTYVDNILSLTLPITFSSNYSSPLLVGYVTFVSSAEAIEAALADMQQFGSPAGLMLITTDPQHAPLSQVTSLEVLLDWPDDTQRGRKINIEQAPFLADALAKKTSAASLQGIRAFNESTSVGVAWITIHDAALAVIFEQKKEIVFSPFRKETKVYVITGVVVCVCACLCTFLMVHFATRGLIQIRKATQTVPKKSLHGDDGSDEEIDLDVERPGPFPISKVRLKKVWIRDEVTDLAETYNDMVSALQAQYETLEDRVRDRTRELEQAKIEAENANKSKTMFLANVSHELRTPLNAILGLTEISRCEMDLDKIKTNLDGVSKSGEILLKHLTDLLMFSRGQAGGMVPEYIDCTITDVMVQADKMIEKSASDAGIKIEMLTPEIAKKVIFKGDGTRILQIMVNLLTNGVKFCSKGDRIQVRMYFAAPESSTRSSPSSSTTSLSLVEKRPTSEYVKNNRIGSSTPSLIGIKNANSSIIIAPDTSGVLAADESFDEKEDLAISYHCKDNDNNNNNEKKRLLSLTICIQDNGPGIGKDKQKKIFDPFVQGDLTYTKKYSGVGLGLSICKQLVGMMNGSIQLVSDVDMGALFIIRLPVEIADKNETIHLGDFFTSNELRLNQFDFIDEGTSNECHFVSVISNEDQNQGKKPNDDDDTKKKKPVVPLPTPPKSPEKSKEKQARILVAEDNQINQTVIIKMLKLAGFINVETANNGKEAVESVEKSKETNEIFEIIFMDVQMPILDGIEATKILRSNDLFNGPIIGLSAFSDDANREKCKLAGMDNFLTKPIRIDVLRSLFDNLGIHRQ